MTDALPVPAAPMLTEEGVAKALTDARGDLFVTAEMFGITVTRLDRYIRASEQVQTVYLAIKQVRALPEYDKLSTQAIEQEVQRRLSAYRADGLEAVHQLATMDIGDNSAMAQVKLTAAMKLMGPTSDNGSGEIEKTLRELNESYQKNAPRVKITRTTIELESRPERVIEAEASPPSAPSS